MNFPGFRLPDELLSLREQIRRVVRDEVIPVEQRIDPDAPELPDDDYQKISAKTKAAGLWALGAPEQYGGGGLDTFSMCVVLEEMSQHRMGLYNPGCGVFGRYPPPAIWAGSKDQIAKYAVPTIRDGLKTFFAITEPSGGSDPAGAIQTRAEKRGDRWVLNGRKVFTSRAHDAPWGLVWARSDKTKGRGGISCFILERGARPRHRFRGADPRRLRCLEGIPARALVPRSARAPHRRGPVRGPPHGDRTLALPLDPGGVSMADEILYAVADGIATITLNRPERRNALNTALMEALSRRFDALDTDTIGLAVLILGAGQAFC